MTNWTVFGGELAHEDVRTLLAQHHAEMNGESPPEACHVMTADSLAADDITFLTLRDADHGLVATGALRTLSRDHGELKSMRVADAWRGKGAGRAMLDALIAEARARGMTRLSLETGNSALFEPANRLYEGAGFVRCGPFAGYRETPFTHFFTREI